MSSNESKNPTTVPATQALPIPLLDSEVVRACVGVGAKAANPEEAAQIAIGCLIERLPGPQTEKVPEAPRSEASK